MIKRLKTSIKGKLITILGGFTLLLCLSYTGIAVLIAYVTEDTIFENLVKHEAHLLLEHHARKGEWANPSAPYFKLIRQFEQLPQVVQRQVSEANAAGRSKVEVFTEQREHYHVLRMGQEIGGPYLVAEVSPFLAVAQTTKNLADFMVIVAVILVLSALLLAYRLARFIAAPILQLSEEMKVQTESLVLPTLSATEREDEIGYLARSLEHNLRALQSALERERLFTRDISHELRTPLTVLNNLAQLQSNGGESPDTAQLQAAVREMELIVETLLSLARSENQERTSLRLLECIEHAALNLEKNSILRNIHYDLEFDEAGATQDQRVDANPVLVQVLLNNILSNALFHGGDGVRIRIVLQTGKILVANSLAVSSVGHGSGMYHGQSLIKRVAENLGWQVTSETTPSEFLINIRYPEQ